jgi:peptidoglycan-associated lipoprotein
MHEREGLTMSRTSTGQLREIASAAFALAALIWTSGCGPTYPKCDTDTDCKQGEFCINGMCQQCRGDQDCPAGQSCASGACQDIPGYCTSTSDCGDGQECQDNLCVTATETAVAPTAPAPVSECSLTPVYFDFDSSALGDSARDQLARNAQCIKEQSMSAVHLTGLTDPRGTEEYNLALGDRRALAAKQYLKSLGVEANISHSSMGEEMASGQDEAGWSRDRRVEIRQK